MKTTAKQRGMTLVEILVAASISLIVVTVGLRFVIQVLKSYQYETGKLLINRDIRKFTTGMEQSLPATVSGKGVVSRRPISMTAWLPGRDWVSSLTSEAPSADTPRLPVPSEAPMMPMALAEVGFVIR